MVRLSRLCVGVLGLFVMMMLAVPAAAQTGGLRGKVTDTAGKPVEGATVLIESKGVARKLTVKTNKKGEFIQIGLYPGEYKVSAEKEGKVAVADNFRVGLGDPAVLDLQLSAGAANTAQEQQKKLAELQTAFDAGVAASKAQNWDEAVSAFQKAATTRAELPRLLLQHRIRLLPEEGLRELGDCVQEGHRAQSNGFCLLIHRIALSSVAFL